MAEVAQGTQQEFWRPPSPTIADAPVVLQAVPSLATACSRCGTEFLTGSRFCHSCGTSRLEAHSAEHADGFIPVAWSHVIHASQVVWEALRKIEFPSWLRYLHFHEIKNSVGLPTASLIAFVIGLGCVAGALLVGLLTARTLIDWQAIQFYRGEWLLAATAAFVAGILLKKSSQDERD
ncbi:MAG: zinc ribbon domain-containing protein [Candidatus Sulfotelmatobacter sp.]